MGGYRSSSILPSFHSSMQRVNTSFQKFETCPSFPSLLPFLPDGYTMMGNHKPEFTFHVSRLQANPPILFQPPSILSYKTRESNAQAQRQDSPQPLSLE